MKLDEKIDYFLGMIAVIGICSLLGVAVLIAFYAGLYIFIDILTLWRTM